MPFKHKYTGEIAALRDRLDPIVKANGWVQKNGYLVTQFSEWFKSHSHLPVSEIEVLFYESKFCKPKPQGISAEINKRRREIWDPQVKRNGWLQQNGSIDSSFSTLIKDNQHLPIDELEKIILSSKFWKLKPERNKPLPEEIKKSRTEVWDPHVKRNGWVQSDGSSIDSNFGKLITKNAHLPIDQLEKMVFASQYWKPKPEGLSAEIKKRRKEVWDPQVKRNGWLHPNGKSVCGDYASLITRNKHLSVDELETTIIASRFWKPKPQGLPSEIKKRRKEVWDPQVRNNGWLMVDGSIDSNYAKLITKNKHLPVDELEQLLIASRFWKPKPSLYLDDEFLLKQMEPIITEVTQVFDEFEGKVYNQTTKASVSKELNRELSKLTTDTQLVKALVSRYFKESEAA